MPTKTRINGQNCTQLPRLVSDGIALKGLPQTPGYPEGYGDLAQAVKLSAILNSQQARKLYKATSQINQISATSSGGLKIGFIGDSWTQNSDRYPNLLARLLQKNSGFSSGGYCGFSYPDSDPLKAFASARSDLYQITITGTTTSQHVGQNFPDMGRVEMSAGSNIRLTYPAGTSSAKLYYSSSSGASVEYRINGGAWTSISLASGGATGAAIPVPATDGDLDIRYQAGTVRLGGINFESAASGVVIHKLGASGSNTNQWAVLPVNWQTITTNLSIDCWVIMLGTNDLQNNVEPNTYKSNIQTIIANCRAASTTNADVLLLSAPEVPAATVNTYTRLEYLGKLQEISASDPFVDVLDLQAAFGASPSDYSSASNYPLMNADNIHPDPLGAFVIAKAVSAILSA